MNGSVWIWLFPFLLIIPNIVLAFTETNSLTMKLANIILPLGVWLTVMGLWRRTGAMMLCLLPVSVLCAFQIVLFYLYGESIIAIDMFTNVLTTNVSEVNELLGNLKMALLTVFVLYLPPIVFGIILCVRHRVTDGIALRRARITGTVLAVIGLVLMVTAWITADRCNPMRELFPLNVTSNVVSTGIRENASSNYAETSRDFSPAAVATRPDSLREVYVFVIGETSRADNWSLFGYGRETNPRLSRRQGVIPFKRTLSEVNTTHKSVPMLMSHLDSRTFGDSVMMVKSIFSAFNEAGYSTVFVSNQRRNHSYIDYYGEEARDARFLTDGENGSIHDDMDLADALSDILAKNKARKIFVILHSYGSHFEYNKRYPRSLAIFQPDNRSEASRANRPYLMNAYDNSIVATDALLDRIAGTLDSLDACAAMIYVSDHGEDIFDDSRGRFLHASPVPTYWQLHVPMILWTSPELDALDPTLRRAALSNADRDASSSQSIFHTLIDLSGIRTPLFRPDQSLTSPEYVPAVHYYLNDYNESVPLDISGLRRQDFEMLRKGGFGK